MKKRRRVIHNSEIRNPFKTYDMTHYEELYIDGNRFPLTITDAEMLPIKHWPPKPLTPHLDMIDRFKAAGVTFEREDEVAKALEILPTVNYYRIAFFTQFLEADKSFTRLLQLFEFDNELRELISSMIPAIENGIKATLAYAVAQHFKEVNYDAIMRGEKHEALAYLDRSIYRKEMKDRKIDVLLSGFADLLESKQEKDEIIKEHLLYYSGHIPIWVLVDFLTLGDTYMVVLYLDRSYRKEWTRYAFKNVNDKWLVDWVRTIQVMRNSCAHHAHLYGSRPTYNPIIPPYDVAKLPEKYREGDKANDQLNKLRHTIFAGVLTMKQFYLILPQHEQVKWNKFIAQLKTLVESHQADYYRIGFPEGWESLLLI